jgi:hypothetical protein
MKQLGIQYTKTYLLGHTSGCVCMCVYVSDNSLDVCTMWIHCVYQHLLFTFLLVNVFSFVFYKNEQVQLMTNEDHYVFSLYIQVNYVCLTSLTHTYTNTHTRAHVSLLTYQSTTKTMHIAANHFRHMLFFEYHLFYHKITQTFMFLILSANLFMCTRFGVFSSSRKINI